MLQQVKQSRNDKRRIAVIGTGISGLAAAWMLQRSHHVSVYEKQHRIGGHSHTVKLPDLFDGQSVDTGFIVYNESNYPNLTALFKHFGVETQKSNMSFAASLDEGRFEYSGNGLFGVLGGGRHALSPRAWKLLAELLRFYRTAASEKGEAANDLTLANYIKKHGFSDAFARDHILPMCAAIWSCPIASMADYPFHTFQRFFSNHGLFDISGRPQWRTVKGGSVNYVTKLRNALANNIQTGCAVASVKRNLEDVEVTDTFGRTEKFDHIILACHSDEALALFEDATTAEKEVLGAIKYQPNQVYLHSDTNLMPGNKRVWSSWNYMDSNDHEQPVAVTYWMNKLQNFKTAKPVFVTLNPKTPPKDELLWGQFTYDHPVFQATAIAAQQKIGELQGRQNTWFAGAWCGYGFHEDGLQSGLWVGEQLSGLARPWVVEKANGRLCWVKNEGPENISETTPRRLVA